MVTSLLALAGLSMFSGPVVPVLFVLGLFFIAAAGVIGVLPLLRLRRVDATIAEAFRSDGAIVFTTDSDGRILWTNERADAEPHLCKGVSVDATLATLYADTQRSLQRLLARAGSEVRTAERVILPSGPAQLSVREIASRRYLWRIGDSAGAGVAEADLGVRFDAEGRIGWMSAALQDAIGTVPATIDALLCDPPLRPNAFQQVRMGEVRLPCFVAIEQMNADEKLARIVPTDASEPSGHFDRLPVPILQLEKDGAVKLANRMARELLTIGKGETVFLSDLVEGLGRPVADWLTDAFEGRALNPEVVRASRSVDDLYVQITLDYAGSEDDGQMMAVLHDATELKTLEAQFVQSQKMQAIGQLAGGVAHDFNNLLTAISGHCDLLLLRHEPGDQDFADLEQINQNASRAASLVGQLLAFSRKQNLRPEPIDLRDILSDLTHLLNRLVGERIRLSFENDPALQMVRADRRQLEQVIMNLVVNARDVMPDGGPIRIRTEQLVLEEALKRNRVQVPPGSYVLVQVIDKGKGIPPDKFDKIFEPFFTTKKTGEGTGLGLSTAYGIVKQTGGYIFADSVLGEGATFSLYFPSFGDAGPIAPAQSIAASKKEVVEQREGVVLLVEDEAPVRAFAARALRMQGYTVFEAEHAEAALEILSDPDLFVDVFVTDVIMPGKDGPAWVREALVERPDTKVIFVSGYAEESFSGNQARIPNSVFLPKPFSLVDLTKTVRAQLES
ncbi:hybrid sensor histidine kinase/response regulator [Palleronia aestuarii]|uniref:hybrid sensor histidine kinase/response regulator n=1 Tax=Palleronia aestuarii TaxID=568105 RepID=UPI001F2EA526|nr:ATP-binding protein [Palleronia aestuarii]